MSNHCIAREIVLHIAAAVAVHVVFELIKMAI